MPPEDKNYIEDLKKSLYSRTAPDVRTRRKLRFTDTNSKVETDWQHPDETEKAPVVLNTKYENHNMSFFSKLLIGSLIFCIAAVGVGAYLFFNGSNLISANNIDIQIAGPISVAGGEPVNFDIVTTNKNNVDLELVDMLVEFPPGTVDPNNPGEALKNYRKLIGNIGRDGSAKESVQAILFGEENTQKQIIVTMTYGVKGSLSVFTKSKTYELLISSSPINVNVDSFKEITSGQEFDFKINIKSNSPNTLKNILIVADYPFGYTMMDSSMPPFSGNNVWKIGDLPSGASRDLTIHGKLNGENSDMRTFHFNVGSQSFKDSKSIGTQYMATRHDITIEKPFISLEISMDGDIAGGDSAGQFGRSKQVNITWFNNLSDAVSNVEIKAKLSGSAYDKTAVSPSGGYFNSANDEIVWSQQTTPELASIAPGASGSVNFSIVPRDLSSASRQITNPMITVVANVLGNRIQESNVPQSVSAVETRNIKISSNVELSGRIVRSTGPFANTGPIPPKAESATTYTVIWSVSNTSNLVENAQVTAILPPHVKWTNMISPSSEKVLFDEKSGRVTWVIDSIDAYTTGSSRRREAAFQISFTPSIDQVGQAVNLVGESLLTAVDGFTDLNLESEQSVLTTRFSTDPVYRQGNEVVVK